MDPLHGQSYFQNYFTVNPNDTPEGADASDSDEDVITIGLNPSSYAFKKSFAFLTVALMLGPVALAGNSYRVLHAFVGGNDGSAPFAGLVMNKQGSLYGTTWVREPTNRRYDFRADAAHRWACTETVLHSIDLTRVRTPSLTWFLKGRAIAKERRRAAAVTELARFLE